MYCFQLLLSNSSCAAISRPYSFSSSAIGGSGGNLVGGGSAGVGGISIGAGVVGKSRNNRAYSGWRHNLMENLVHEQRSEHT